MDFTKFAMKSLLEDLRELNLHLESIKNVFKSEKNNVIIDHITLSDDISKLKKLQVKLIRINDVY